MTRDCSLFVNGKRCPARQSPSLYRLAERRTTQVLCQHRLTKKAFVSTGNFHQEALEGRNLLLDSSLPLLLSGFHMLSQGSGFFYFFRGY